MAPESAIASPAGDDHSKRGLLRRALDALFGFDFFISYAWKDGGVYAAALAKRLEDEGFEVFLDRSDYAAGDDWKTVGAWTLRRTGQLILVGSPAALQSAPVCREIEIFAETGRRITPIDFDGTLDWQVSASSYARHLPAEILRIREPATALETGPSRDTLSTIRRSFTLVRQDKKRARAFAVIASILFVLAITALVFGIVAELQRERAERTIETATRSAENYVKDVARSLRIAKGLPLKDVDSLIASAESMLNELGRYDPKHPDVVAAKAMLLREKSQTALGRGNYCEALRRAEQAYAMLAGLPRTVDRREDLAFAHNRIGDVLRRMSRNEDAIAHYREALRIRLGISDGGASAPGALAKSYEDLGDALIATGRRQDLEEAATLTQRRLELALQRAKTSPDSVEAQEELAKSYERAAFVASQRGQDPTDTLQKILAIRERISALGEKGANYQEGLANIYSTLAFSGGCSSEAVAYHSKALTIRRSLAAAGSDNEGRRTSLARTLNALAECGVHAKDYKLEADRISAPAAKNGSHEVAGASTCADSEKIQAGEK